MPSLLFLALVAVIGGLALLPTRRLFLAGWSGRTIGTYFFGVLALGLLVAEFRGPAKFLVPLLVAAFAAPFILTRAGFGRLPRAGGGPQPVVRRPLRRQIRGPVEIIEPREHEGAGARPVGSSGPDDEAGSGRDGPPEVPVGGREPR